MRQGIWRFVNPAIFASVRAWGVGLPFILHNLVIPHDCLNYASQVGFTYVVNDCVDDPGVITARSRVATVQQTTRFRKARLALVAARRVTETTLILSVSKGSGQALVPATEETDGDCPLWLCIKPCLPM